MSKCPSCNSTNTKTMKMIYMGGIRNSKGDMGGMSISTSGRVSFGIGKSRSKSISNLASMCAPPVTKSPISYAVGMFFLVLLLSSIISTLFLSIGIDISGGISFLGFCLALFFSFKTYENIKTEQKEATNNYENQWMCLKCGTKFIP